MAEFCYILDASALEKGVGHIKKWCDQENKRSDVALSLYIPSYTLQELDFLKFRRNSPTAREALHFIDHTTTCQDGPEIIIEFPDLLDTIVWSEVLAFQTQELPEYDLTGATQRSLLRRYKMLLKSCVYKCHLEGRNDKTWILVTEDSTVRRLANAFQIPYCSVVAADGDISRQVDKRSHRRNVKFNKYLKKKSTKEVTNGKEVYKTNFSDMMYAPRGGGELWSP
ncbi:LAMI_0A03510g1_1 [Lachancea mirantina]|uniref:LAMI_0A03510g1_1 n=1 Tax=Lachancea mirantina TaxID=1230905 RepID=A0A1G4INE7_9SACH|nr:LAMI_0A03510g1_1 [Lachancea mirantina]